MPAPESSADHSTTRSSPPHAWVLAAGLVLATLGLAAPQQGQEGEERPPTMPQAPAGAVADSNNRMIAVTGVDITGASVLYLIDTIDYRLAVYQATGGAETTQGIKLIGARRIDLDLKLHGLNDRSQYTYEALREQFAAKGLLDEER
jgi:hypothetical protein